MKFNNPTLISNKKFDMQFYNPSVKSELKLSVSNVLLGMQDYKTKGKTKSKHDVKTILYNMLDSRMLIEPQIALKYRNLYKYKIDSRLKKIPQVGYKYQTLSYKQSMTHKNINSFNSMPFNFNFNFNLPSFSGGGYSSSKSNTYYKGKKRKTAYAPSLSAFQLGLSAPKGYKTNKKYTGLEIRPVLYDAKETFDDSYRKRLSKIANFF
jgi:hypothetical protein